MPKIIFCKTCNIALAGHSLAGLIAQVETELDKAGLKQLFGFAQAECMGACEQPLAMALQGKGLATYLFAGIEPDIDAPDIAATCKTWLESPDGWIENALGCGRLRHCLRARIPAL